VWLVRESRHAGRFFVVVFDKGVIIRLHYCPVICTLAFAYKRRGYRVFAVKGERVQENLHLRPCSFGVNVI
jgi:hypothetical protein